MGRYAFFNTRYEYKFAFGIQSSFDIELFAGEDKTKYTDEGIPEGYGERIWTQKDKDYIYEKLQELADEDGYEIPQFTEIEKTLEGTYMIEEYIKVKGGISNTIGIKEQYYTFRLGCIIYHQLLYTDILTVEYEY